MVVRVKLGVATTSGAGARAMADYLVSEPLRVENSTLAKYYSGESLSAPSDLIGHYGTAVAQGDIGYSEALDALMRVYPTLGHTEVERQDQEETISLRLAEAAARAGLDKDVDAPDRTVAVVRPDMAPEVAAGLGIDRLRAPTLEELSNLLNGLRAAGDRIEGKQQQAPMRSLVAIFGLDERTLPSAEAVGHILAGRRVDGSEAVGPDGKAFPDGVVQGGVKRFLSIYDAKLDPAPEQTALIKAGRTINDLPIGLDEYQRKVTATKAPIAYADVVFAADKSVSVVFALGNEAERGIIVAVQNEAVERTLAYMEDAALGYRRLGKEGAGGIEKGKIGWVSVNHFTSRPTYEFAETDSQGEASTRFQAVPLAVADPHIHTHALVFSTVFGGASGKVGSIDFDQLDGKIKEFGGVYHAFMARGLRAHGIEAALDPETGSARIMSVPSSVRAHFSKRSKDAHTQAREFAASKGLDWDSLAREHQVKLLQKGVMETRNRKAEKPPTGADGKPAPEVDDFAEWRRQAKQDAGYAHRSVLRPDAIRPERDTEERRAKAYDVTLPLTDRAFSQRAKFGAQELREIATRGLVEAGISDRPGEDIAAVTQAYRERGVLQDGKRTPLIWGKDGALVRGREKWSVTTGAHETIERDLVRLAKAAQQDRGTALPVAVLDRHVATFLANNPKIDTTDPHWLKQRAALYAIGTGGKLAGFIGAAGAGKTTVLQPAVAAWHEEGRAVYGIALANAHAAAMRGSGIEEKDRASVAAFFRRVETGRYTLDQRSVVVVDEFGRMGSRDFLRLMEMRAKIDFEIKFLGDPKQCQAVEAPVFAVLTKAFPDGTFPEIDTTRRQAMERDRMIAGLLREGQAAEALAMKRQDGTITLVTGGRQATIDAVAQLWRQKTEANAGREGYALAISAPTNADVHDIGLAVRSQRRVMGRLGKAEFELQVTDGAERERAVLTLSEGDRVRLFDRVHLAKGHVLGNNSDFVTVVGFAEDGILARNDTGLEGLIRYDKIASADGRALRLGYGYARTIDSSQGTTVTEHLNAFPSGSAAATGFKAYTGDSRAVEQSTMIVNEAAERRAIDARIPHGADRTIRVDDVYANIARNFSRQPEKGTALDFIQTARELRRGTVMNFRASVEPVERGQREAGIGNPVRAQRAQAAMDQVIALRQVLDHVRDFAQRLQQQVHRAAQNVQRQAHQHRGPRMRR